MKTWIKPYQQPAARPAFTLVELLVVIAIIGVMVGLLLPAVQAAREAARRMSCSNNLAQLGLALHNHEFSWGYLPAGSTNPTGPIQNIAEGQHVSFLVRLLPYMEQQALADLFDVEAGAYADSNTTARRANIATFSCPSHPYRHWPEDQAPSMYAGNYHHVEAPLDIDNSGLLFLNSQIQYRDIYDGSSNTILVGEIVATDDTLGWVSGTRATLRNTGHALEEGGASYRGGQTSNPLFTPSNDLEMGGYGSFHPGGALFCLADGSVRFLSQTLQAEVLSNLGNRADGQFVRHY